MADEFLELLHFGTVGHVQPSMDLEGAAIIKVGQERRDLSLTVADDAQIHVLLVLIPLDMAGSDFLFETALFDLLFEVGR